MSLRGKTLFTHSLGFLGCDATDQRFTKPGRRLPGPLCRLEPPGLPLGHRRSHSGLSGDPQEHGKVQEMRTCFVSSRLINPFKN